MFNYTVVADFSPLFSLRTFYRVISAYHPWRRTSIRCLFSPSSRFDLVIRNVTESSWPVHILEYDHKFENIPELFVSHSVDIVTMVLTMWIYGEVTRNVTLQDILICDKKVGYLIPFDRKFNILRRSLVAKYKLSCQWLGLIYFRLFFFVFVFHLVHN